TPVNSRSTPWGQRRSQATAATSEAPTRSRQSENWTCSSERTEMTKISRQQQPIERHNDPRMDGQHTGLGQKMTITKLALIAATAAATIAVPATAQADPSYQFQSPSGNIFCLMGVGGDGTGSVVCQGGGPYAVPTPPNCHLAWGDR